jgi:HAD superfamily hydrolase (TIGR01490 family)
MHLALFDLDHTLIPFDSGLAFTRFLVERGVLGAQDETAHVACCERYVRSEWDIVALHRATTRLLHEHDCAQVQQWAGEFAAGLGPRVPAVSHALVRQHRGAGHRCVLVTATAHWLAQPVARVLGIETVLATESAVAGERFSGDVVGSPCHGPHKLAHVQTWLAGETAGVLRRPADCARSWFYTDAYSDVPLLEAVSDPVAVAPDARLRALARQRGWPVHELVHAQGHGPAGDPLDVAG